MNDKKIFHSFAVVIFFKREKNEAKYSSFSFFQLQFLVDKYYRIMQLERV